MNECEHGKVHGWEFCGDCPTPDEPCECGGFVGFSVADWDRARALGVELSPHAPKRLGGCRARSDGGDG